ncbi:AAA family ATPase [Priestia flexa]|uniref:AAA family ATPase n=1 Tax=Priestia flexa TaxID=86664 RepID=UPI001CFE715F|nr:AAA family ATPase [Priestia flexa]
MNKNMLKNLPVLIRASLEGDKRAVELSAFNLIRKIRNQYPDISDEIAEILTTYSSGASLTRSMGVNPPPTDNESYASLVKIEEFTTFDENLILDTKTDELISRFIKERQVSQKLISMGIRPPNSIILYGQPGVGKTMISKYLSKKLELPLITLDLSSTISSYLGKTGQNLKKVLDYAKLSPSILLIDEFDAVAKRRDDPSDLGELKRIVNVLLKELEEWPPNSIIIAATNFPDYLDKAIWRRFDLKVEVPLPSARERYELWKENLNKNEIHVDVNIIELVSSAIDNVSPSDIKQISEKVIREVIIDNTNPNLVLLEEIRDRFTGKSRDYNKVMVNKINETFKRKITQAEIANLLGISISTVNHHLKNQQNNVEER